MAGPLVSLLLASGGVGSIAYAHELGDAGVLVSLDVDRSVIVEVVAPPAELRARLALLSGVVLDDVSSSVAWPADLAAELVARVDARADGSRIALRPDVDPVVVDAGTVRESDADGPRAIRLRGTAPADAATFTWSSSLFLGAYPLSVETPAGAVTVEWLAPRQTSRAIAWTPEASSGERRAAATRTASRAGQYVTLGFTQILPHGLDHVLFVVGLFFLAPGWRALLLQVSAFTLAHSVTLALALLGLFTMPPALVEPLIAASIVFVAIENLVAGGLGRTRLAVVFAFGLLHGAGFASVLAELLPDRASLAPALLGFNVGVEAGQLAVIALAASATTMLRLSIGVPRRVVATAASVAIAAIGLAWTWQRVAGPIG